MKKQSEVKFSITGLSAEELLKCQQALGLVDLKENEDSTPVKKASKKTSKKVVEEEDEENEVEEDEVEEEEESEDDEVDFDEEDEDEDEDEESEEDDSDEDEDEDEEVVVKNKKKVTKKAAPASKAATSKVTIEEVMKAFQDKNKELTKKLKSDQKAKAKIASLLKKIGAKSPRAIDPKKYSLAIKELKAL